MAGSDQCHSRRKHKDLIVDVDELPRAKVGDMVILLGSLDEVVKAADGLLKPCLYSDVGIDLMPDLKSDIDKESLKSRIRQVAMAKPKGHKIGEKEYCFAMNRIGG